MENKLFWEQLANAIELPFDIEDVKEIEQNPGGTHIVTKTGTYFVMVEQCEVPVKKFLWVDKSGGGRRAPMLLEDLLKMDDAENPDHVNWDGDTLAEWAENAEEGDDWQNAANRYICVGE